MIPETGIESPMQLHCLHSLVRKPGFAHRRHGAAWNAGHGVAASRPAATGSSPSIPLRQRAQTILRGGAADVS